ncbi:glycerate kinase [Holotrichia oblita]|uniref:Glycerate kinase n=1 Tax=Holotrichia oblita TaxID=644536 RepID=A0ACB9T8A2_HOLOL|nr:glycerate kinase [Holotrichia oblita]
MNTNSQHLSQIFMQGVAAVRPEILLANTVRIENDNLIVNNNTFHIKKHCYVVGFGKAVLGMAVQLEKILGSALSCGIATVPQDILRTFATLPELLPPPNTRITFIEGAKDNLPDLNALNGAVKIRDLITNVDEGNILIVLISGGGSALLPIPKQPITLEEKTALIKSLSKAGATIVELNTVRKKLSELKGGRLALLAKHLTVITLILSDVIDDPLDYIASGPTVPNSDEPDAALNIISKYHLLDIVPDTVHKILMSDTDGSANTNGSQFDWVYNVVIGNNKMACEGAVEQAKKLGYQTVVLTRLISADVGYLSEWYGRLVRLIITCSQLELQELFQQTRSNLWYDLVNADEILNFDMEKPICLIGAGEPTLVVRGKGRGGRNQELALRVSLELDKMNITKKVMFLSAGTDGIDGPTDVAGAIGDWRLVSDARSVGIEPIEFISNNDSYGFYTIFKDGEYFVKTGHTGTNVMDLHIITIVP